MKPRIAIPVPHSNAEYAHRALPQYQQAVEQAGGEPVVIDLGLPNAEIARLATQCDAILLPGSRADIDPQKYGAALRNPKTAPSDPPRDNADELLLQDAYNLRKPILGICYGLQALNVWRSGSLVQHIESGINHEAGRAVEKAHPVDVDPVSGLARILKRQWQPDKPNLQPGEKLQGWVNSSHHQAAGHIGDGLRAVAWSPEDHVVEAIEGTAPDHFVLGVQWHPERTTENDAASRAIFRAFVDAAGKK